MQIARYFHRFSSFIHNLLKLSEKGSFKKVPKGSLKVRTNFVRILPYLYLCTLGVLYPEHWQLAFDCVVIAFSLESISQA